MLSAQKVVQCAGRRLFSSATAVRGVVPIVDFEPFLTGTAEDKATVAAELGEACEHIGFFVLSGHQVDPAVIDNAWSSTQQFFDMDNEYKASFTPENEAEYPYGYSGFGAEILSAGLDKETGSTHQNKPDLKECFAMGPYNPASGMPAPRLPSRPESMEAAWFAYYKAMEKLSANVLQAFALALDLPETWFEDKIDRHRCALRALNYPDLDAPPLPGQLRASAHTDYGTLTILRPDDAPGGLQVMQKNGEWASVPHLPDAYVINIGDLMQRWTNDKWVSTLHRVVPPPMDTGRSCRRQSMAFFHNINPDHVVTCIETCATPENPAKYPPIAAFDHLMEKHLASMGQTPESAK